MSRTDQPLNDRFWIAVAAISLAGGLILGRAAGINDEWSAYSRDLGAAAIHDSARREARNLDVELRDIYLQFDDREFRDLDAELDEL